MKPLRVIFPGMVAASLLFFAGCGNPPDKSAEKKKPADAAQGEDYVMVNSMGSWIPRKVKKKGDLIGDGTQVLEGQALEKVTQRGSTNTVKESQLTVGGSR